MFHSSDPKAIALVRILRITSPCVVVLASILAVASYIAGYRVLALVDIFTALTSMFLAALVWRRFRI